MPDDPTFRPITPVPMRDPATIALREAILTGRLVPGSQLREVGLATQLGVSRGPVREALRSLEEEGLVVKVPYRGAFVAGADPAAISEIARLRERMEPWAVTQGLEHLRGVGGVRLRSIVTAMDEAAGAGDVGRAIDAHLAFHRTLYEAPGIRRLAGLWATWETELRLGLAVDHRSFGRLADVAALHARFLEIIATGDPVQIEAEVTSHLRNTPTTASAQETAS
ncbi:MAG: GntR family transcriptional regulator [Chloroflexota bacterium]